MNPEFTVFSGFDEYYLVNRVSGGNGVLCGLTNVEPETFAKMHAAYQAGDYATAVSCAERISKLMAVYDVCDLFVSAIDAWPVFLPAPKKVRARVAACLERVHAESLIDKRIGSLSGGELQRVLLAMALEPVPHILILDEPLSGVDIEGEKQLLDMLDEVRRSYDLSILLSTHDFATLEEYADKVILLKSTVLKVGTPAEVLSSDEFKSVFHLDLRKGAGA